MSDEALKQQIDSWQAQSWDELREAWSNLFTSASKPPSFRSIPLNLQQAGWLFERLILDAFRLDGCAGTYPFRASTQEQVDGFILDPHGWQGFLIESKFKSKRIGIDPIYRLHALTEQRPVGTLGLFFSSSGYTRGARLSVRRLRPIRVLLFWTLELEWALAKPGRMMELIRRKWAFAVQFGKPDVPIAEWNASRELVAVSQELFGKATYDEPE